MGVLSNYCGFGGGGVPMHKIDKLCKEHDEAYQRMLDRGINPYLGWNSADARMQSALNGMRATTSREHIIKPIINGIWFMKRTFLSTLNPHDEQLIKDGNFVHSANAADRRDHDPDAPHPKRLRGHIPKHLHDGQGNIGFVRPDDVQPAGRQPEPPKQPEPAKGPKVEDPEPKRPKPNDFNDNMILGRPDNTAPQPFQNNTVTGTNHNNPMNITPQNTNNNTVNTNNSVTVTMNPDGTVSGGNGDDPQAPTMLQGPHNNLIIQQKNQETAVSEWPGEATFGLPNTHTTKTGAYFTCVTTSISDGNARLAAPVRIFNFSLNDVNIPLKFPTYAITGATAADIPKARWHDYWSGLYEKCTVLKCEFEILLDMYGPNSSTYGNVINEFDIFWGIFVGKSGAMVQPDPDTKYDLFSNSAVRHAGSLSSLWNYNSATLLLGSNVETYTKGKGCVIKGSYVSGTKNGLIEDDGDRKIWYPVATTPTFLEDLTVWAVRKYNKDVSDIAIHADVALTYTIQYKDVVQAYRIRNYTINGTGSSGVRAIET